MKNNSNPKLIILNSIQKQGFLGPSHRLYLVTFLTIFTLVLLFLTFLTTKQITFYSSSSSPSPSPSSSSSSSPSSSSAAASSSSLSPHVLDALLHYYTLTNVTSHISLPDLRSIATALRRCPAPCNFLVFGLTHETLLWNAINHNGRTVFLDENRYYAAWFEQSHPNFEVYDIHYTTSVAQMPALLSAARHRARTDCRPVQNLLFSECSLALNDLPNSLYDVDWDVILVDGPRGWAPDEPGRMSAIFTAAVLARSRRNGGAATSIFVHDFQGEVEKVCSEEFLCGENLVESSESLAHFAVKKADPDSFEFCRNSTSSRPPK